MTHSASSPPITGLSKRETWLVRMLLRAEIEDMRESESPGHSHADGIAAIEALLGRLPEEPE